MTFYSNFGVISWVLIALIAVLVIAVIVQLIRYIKMRKAGPSHIEEYFEANFRNIINEWDLVTHPRVKEWKTGMTGRLSALSDDIGFLEAGRTKIDKRLFKFEAELERLEKY